ncbi:MAG: SAM-dependent methyltransferase [Polyangiaceae bacterium]
MESIGISRTAALVCAARAIGISSKERDPLAAMFIPARQASTLDRFARDDLATNTLRLTLRAATLGLVDHNTIRMLIVDDFLKHWTKDGCSQVVLLGAGLDARSWRMGELARLRVFELDRWKSQSEKAMRATSLGAPQARVRFVPIDFERDRLDRVLLDAGFSTTEPTAWIAEGVTAYFARDTTRRIFREAAAVSAPSSKFAVSYVTPPSGSSGWIARNVTRRLLSRWGEPLRGTLNAEEVQALVQEAGLRILDDLDWNAWRRSAAISTRLPNLLKERLMIASKGE